MNKQEEINKYLTEHKEVFDECWHEFNNKEYKCNKCGVFLGFGYTRNKNKVLFTNEGCMTLWLKIQKKDWFNSFMDYVVSDYEVGAAHVVSLIHPDRLATEVYEFLKERENE